MLKTLILSVAFIAALAGCQPPAAETPAPTPVVAGEGEGEAAVVVPAVTPAVEAGPAIVTPAK